MKVSVIVPIYNAGKYIDPRSRTLLGQTLSHDDYEIIYVNDGSTDDSPERLDRLAAKHPNIRVHHQENSGWPGKPRNVAVRMARGEYVQFVDQDDEIAPDALEELYTVASRHGADIAFGKTYGRMQGPIELFRQRRESCTVADAELFETLTPHKMFRRQFLIDNDIRFPEGRVRLEDQLFLAKAYPRAKAVTVLGDRPTYHWHHRDDGGNNSKSTVDLEVYFGHLRNVLREIKANSEPGPLQDKMLTRNYRVELLRGVTEPKVLQRRPEVLQQVVDLCGALGREEMPPTVAAGLPAVQRLRAQLLEAGDVEGLLALARELETVQPHVTYGETRWRDGTLVVPLQVRLLRADGTPFTVARHQERLLLDPRVVGAVDAVDDWEVGDPLHGTFGRILVRDTQRLVWWFAPTDLEPRWVRVDDATSEVVFEADVELDARTLAGGRPLPTGRHAVWMEVHALGMRRRQRLPLPSDSTPEQQARVDHLTRVALVGDLQVAAGFPNDRLFLDVAEPTATGVRARLQRLAADDAGHAWAQRARRAVATVRRRG